MTYGPGPLTAPIAWVSCPMPLQSETWELTIVVLALSRAMQRFCPWKGWPWMYNRSRYRSCGTRERLFWEVPLIPSRRMSP